MPKTALPIPPGFEGDESYVESLLAFATSDELFQKLCGGVHILDFLTQEPDLYSALLPQDWRHWFRAHEIQDVLDLLMREDLSSFCHDPSVGEQAISAQLTWRGKAVPPPSLIEYIRVIRRYTLRREHAPDLSLAPAIRNRLAMPRAVAVGMKPKKIHEVGNFARYIDELITTIHASSEHRVSHLVDFGSGQNYLGRALASSPYCKDIIAIESRPHNIDGAKNMDISAKLAKKEKIMRNKKAFRSMSKDRIISIAPNECDRREDTSAELQETQTSGPQPSQVRGSIQYVESFIEDGDLSKVIPQLKQAHIPSTASCDPQLLVIALHSCGNLLHHGLRSLVLNPSVKAVAMVGCCYNLVTERLGPATYKLPTLRHHNPRLDRTSAACDPHGFPMSERLATYKHSHGEGIRLNITARMMAVQAPRNWTPEDSEAFFTRHFYRALLQRLFVDRGIVGRPSNDADAIEGCSPRGWTGVGQPIILGSLRKSCYDSFTAYVRGAVTKLRHDAVHGPHIAKAMDGVTDGDLAMYEARFSSKKKELSVVWSLMAFSAGVVESMIVVDRWLYLREQDVVGGCWVEPVFDYGQSPRNLVVVGIKK